MRLRPASCGLVAALLLVLASVAAAGTASSSGAPAPSSLPSAGPASPAPKTLTDAAPASPAQVKGGVQGGRLGCCRLCLAAPCRAQLWRRRCFHNNPPWQLAPSPQDAEAQLDLKASTGGAQQQQQQSPKPQRRSSPSQAGPAVHRQQIMRSWLRGWAQYAHPAGGPAEHPAST